MNEIHSINAPTLKKLLDNNEAILIDVRELREYQTGYIPTAIHIPLGTIENDKLPDTGNKKLVIHCGIGKRSYMACEKLLRENPNLNLYNLEGGITAWKQHGYSVKTLHPSATISLDRQIQIFIGGFILLGLVLGYFLHPLFFVVSLFFSLLLLYSGIRGSSLLAMLMASMPWNKKKI